MKKIILLTAFAALIFGSCKKDSSKTGSPVTKTAVNTFSATINDTNRIFTNALSAKFYDHTDVPGQILEINGVTDSIGESLEVEVSSTGNVTKGVYSDAGGNANVPELPLILDTKNSDSYNTVVFLTESYYPMTINITSLTSTNVQGTFSGVLRGDTGGGPTETVTNGKFNVNITAQ